jgi:hypothetical protein
MSDGSNLWRKDATRGYALLRVTLGLNMCLHGVVRWVGGLRGFALRSGGGRTIGRLQSRSHISPDDVKSCNFSPALSVR